MVGIREVRQPAIARTEVERKEEGNRRLHCVLGLECLAMAFAAWAAWPPAVRWVMDLGAGAGAGSVHISCWQEQPVESGCSFSFSHAAVSNKFL